MFIQVFFTGKLETLDSYKVNKSAMIAPYAHLRTLVEIHGDILSGLIYNHVTNNLIKIEIAACGSIKS